VPIYNALKQGYRRIIAILPRRAGKDFLSWNLLIREAIRKPGIYWVVLPTSVLARTIYWDGRDSNGKPWLDCIPKELIRSIHQQEMKVHLINNSVLQLHGSLDPDRLVGANCSGVILSEYALINPLVYDQILSPQIKNNNGFAIFLSTPRGKSGNDLWNKWNIAQNNPLWFSYIQTIEQTQHMSVAEIKQLIASGELEESLALQEYWCSWERGAADTFYGPYLDKARLEGRINHVPHEPGLLVYSAWDIGVNDNTAIILFQVAGQTVRVINCYSNKGLGVDHYINWMDDQQRKWGYKYHKHFAPWDIMVREFGAGAITRYEQARQLGLTFTPLEQIGLYEGINNVWMNFQKFYFDEAHTKGLLSALENYRREWDEVKRIHGKMPIHNWTSHYCFTEDNTILMSDKTQKRISEIKIGDEILTPFGARKVLKTHQREVKELCEIQIGSTKVITTPGHDIFTQSGIVSADSLSYNDEIESYSSLKQYVWKKLYGYLSEEEKCSGFKRIILSQKTKKLSSLMDSIIGGMEDTLSVERLHEMAQVICTEPFGNIIMGQYPQKCISIIKTTTEEIIESKTLNYSHQMNILECICCLKDHGHNQKNANNKLNLCKKKLNYGILHQKEKNGIVSTLIKHCQRSWVKHMIMSVFNVKKNLKGILSLKNSVQTIARRGIEFIQKWITLNVLVPFVKSHSKLINILTQKHVVKSVAIKHLSNPVTVYDLTIEKDNCYYVNGYLVSNSDSFRYLCQALPLCNIRNSTPEELEKRFNRSLNPRGNEPSFTSHRY